MVMYKMVNNKKETFEITFRAKTRIKAFSKQEAMQMVNDSHDVKVTKITTNNLIQVLAENTLINLSTLLTLALSFMYVGFLVSILTYMQSISVSYIDRLIFTLVWFGLFLSTIRFPSKISRWFDNLMYVR